MVTSDAKAAEEQLRRENVSLVSSGVISLPEEKLGFRKGVLVRDPDGHAVELAEKCRSFRRAAAKPLTLCSAVRGLAVRPVTISVERHDAPGRPGFRCLG